MEPRHSRAPTVFPDVFVTAQEHRSPKVNRLYCLKVQELFLQNKEQIYMLIHPCGDGLELAQICIRPIYTCSLYRTENTNSKAAAQGVAGLCDST